MFTYVSHAHSSKPLIGVETPKTVCLTVSSPAFDCPSPAIGTVSRGLHPIMAAPYIRCPGRILLKEQQVLSINYN